MAWANSAYYCIRYYVTQCEGTYVRSYGDVKHPTGIVIDEGYSLVDEWTGHYLSIFDSEGNKIHTVSNLNNPDGVLLDPKGGSLYVVKLWC